MASFKSSTFAKFKGGLRDVVKVVQPSASTHLVPFYAGLGSFPHPANHSVAVAKTAP